MRGLVCLLLIGCLAGTASAQYGFGPTRPTMAQEREMKRQSALREKQLQAWNQQMEIESQKQQKLFAEQQKKVQAQMLAEKQRRARDPKYAAEQEAKEQRAQQQAVAGLAVLGLLFGMAMSDSQPNYSPSDSSEYFRGRKQEQDEYDRARRTSEAEAERANSEWQRKLWSPNEYGR